MKENSSLKLFEYLLNDSDMLVNVVLVDVCRRCDTNTTLLTKIEKCASAVKPSNALTYKAV